MNNFYKQKKQQQQTFKFKKHTLETKFLIRKPEIVGSQRRNLFYIKYKLDYLSLSTIVRNVPLFILKKTSGIDKVPGSKNLTKSGGSKKFSNENGSK